MAKKNKHERLMITLSGIEIKCTEIEFCPIDNTDEHIMTQQVIIDLSKDEFDKLKDKLKPMQI